MKVYRLLAFTVAAATLCTASYAQIACKKPKTTPTPIVSKVVADSFQLTQVSTKVLSATSSTSLYKGETVLTITSDDPTAQPVVLPVKVELKTQTILNVNGDGMTDGVITLYAPSTKQAISGCLVAVNKNFGDLSGVISGALLNGGSTQSSLRAIFHGVFVQDNTGAYTLVNVDASGVLVSIPRAGGPKK